MSDIQRFYKFKYILHTSNLAILFVSNLEFINLFFITMTIIHFLDF